MCSVPSEFEVDRVDADPLGDVVVADYAASLPEFLRAVRPDRKAAAP